MTPIAQFVRDFRADKAAATAKYNGKTLTMRGKVDRINEFAGAYNLYLLDPQENEGLVVWLANAADAKTTAVGKEVIVRCQVKGEESVVQACVML
jgi:hypothetical protein